MTSLTTRHEIRFLEEVRFLATHVLTTEAKLKLIERIGTGWFVLFVSIWYSSD